MKTPRFFIALAACAFVFAVASSSFAPLVRSCGAESMPVLRVDPRMGDPEDPGFSRKLPFDDWIVDSQVSSAPELQARVPIAEPSGRARGWLARLRDLWLNSYLAKGRR